MRQVSKRLARTEGVKSAPYRMNRDVLLVSFCAYFADLGCQTAIAVFPIFLVLVLGAPSYAFGVAKAVTYGNAVPALTKIA